MIVPSCPFSSMSKRAVPPPASASETDRRQRRRLAPQEHTPRQAEVPIHLVRCECGSVARGALSDDGRCTNALGRDEHEHGHTLCSRCRPPGCLVRFRARRIARNLDRMIRESGNQFEPALNFEISRGDDTTNCSSAPHNRCAAVPAVTVALGTFHNGQRLSSCQMPGQTQS